MMSKGAPPTFWLYMRRVTQARPFAMQKIEGSNPFSRSQEKTRSGGAFSFQPEIFSNRGRGYDPYRG
jgi:hypothetical protein